MDDQHAPHPSEPHNPKVANGCSLAGQIESWGRGVQKNFNECKLDGIGVPGLPMVLNDHSVECEASHDRLASAGSPRKEITVSSMDRADSSRNRADSSEEHDDSDAGWADSSGSSRNVHDGFNASTLQHSEEHHRSRSDADQCGRHEVIEAIGRTDSRTGHLLKQMLEAGLIEQVKGHGQGG